MAIFAYLHYMKYAYLGGSKKLEMCLCNILMVPKDFLGYIPPSVTLYTGISDLSYFICYFVLFALHLIAILILKQNVSQDFQEANVLDKLLHSAECTSFAYPLYDWDFKKRGSPNDHYVRMKKVQLEGSLNILINFFFSCCHLIPLIYLYVQISRRHLILEATISTLKMEDEAYELAFYMAWVGFPMFMIIGIGQFLLFNAYNNKFHPFNIVLKGAENHGRNKEMTLFQGYKNRYNLID